MLTRSHDLGRDRRAHRTARSRSLRRRMVGAHVPRLRPGAAEDRPLGRVARRPSARRRLASCARAEPWQGARDRIELRRARCRDARDRPGPRGWARGRMALELRRVPESAFVDRRPGRRGDPPLLGGRERPRDPPRERAGGGHRPGGLANPRGGCPRARARLHRCSRHDTCAARAIARVARATTRSLRSDHGWSRATRSATRASSTFASRSMASAGNERVPATCSSALLESSRTRLR